jgi:cysteinyl-tRNA synthetase
MKIFNTLSRQIEKFEPFNPPQVGLYACGLTVYDYTHLGHLRKYTMDDVLIRALEHEGYKVNHVQNVTDVGHLASDADTGQDKLEKGAEKYGSTVKAIARKFENYFFQSMDLMGNKKPDVICRATEHIDDMIALVKQLEQRGFTYEIENDGIYFDTSQLDDYGQLANLDVEGLKEGARVKKVEGKRNPTDFALWKFEREEENRAMAWASPWGQSTFPGWHVECSAMSMKYLGPQFDIHTGGIDHIPVHHPNEIAQSEAATGQKPFVKYWVHHNHLMVEGEKMSKSKGNFYTIDDVLDRGFEPEALRLLFLNAHYRTQQNFTWDSLAASQKSWDKLKKVVPEWQQAVESIEEVEDVNGQPLGDKAAQYKSEFFDAIGHDLNTPEAVAVMWQVVDSDLKPQKKLKLLLDFDQVLGLNLSLIKDIDLFSVPDEVELLVVKRQKAREAEAWEKADQIRQQIEDKGFEITDTKQGQIIRKKVS